MNIKELAEKYELVKDDFLEHRKGTWIIKHDACIKIAHIEGIGFDKPEYNYNIPTTFTENDEKMKQYLSTLRKISDDKKKGTRIKNIFYL